MIYPPDIDEAYAAFGANCGPCSLAAILERPVNDVRALLEGFDRRRYCNPTHIQAALNQAGVQWHTIGQQLPHRGLAFIQFGGHDHLPIKVQYTFTHWIGVDGKTIFEVNAPFFVTWDQWQKVMPLIIQDEGRGDGTFFIRSGIELTLNSQLQRAAQVRDGPDWR